MLLCFVSLQKHVKQNKEILSALRSSFDKPEQMKELQRRLQSTYFLPPTPPKERG